MPHPQDADEAFLFQIATDNQAETDRLWNPMLDHPDRAAATRAFTAMMSMVKIDIAAIEAAGRS